MDSVRDGVLLVHPRSLGCRAHSRVRVARSVR